MIRRSSFLSLGLLVASLVALGYAILSIVAGAPSRPVLEPVFQPPQVPDALGSGARGPDIGWLGALGIVEPASQEIVIGASVSGVVRHVFVEAGGVVKNGDPLFLIDDRTAQAELAVTEGELHMAQAVLDELIAKVPSAHARVAAAEARAHQIKAELAELQVRYHRAQDLARVKAIAIEELQMRRVAAEVCQSKLAAAEALWQEARAELALLTSKDEGPAPSIKVKQAFVDKAKASVEMARTHLQLHTVHAPITGSVLRVHVRAGEFAASATRSQPLMVLGTVTPLHVRVSIDEVDIPRFQPQAQAFACLRGRATEQVRLTFVRIEPLVIPKRSLTGAMQERVDTRVMEIIYSIDSAWLPAYVGQQVDVYIRPNNSR